MCLGSVFIIQLNAAAWQPEGVSQVDIIELSILNVCASTVLSSKREYLVVGFISSGGGKGAPPRNTR